ncbi:uncharacterized protein FIBRA_00237 [Fibroporia radiculosa]|uniref:Uncharacterized protein n=1 Tax=Fibroporia radiculosa TaxID=599839 RepID=J7SCM6_9APHY|nr:uncharacterized protein FIBRA_00237 [Fibroporia radiculosa]CCL98243.1 predicted protein [Fibroporia radiculosa]
MSYDQPQQFDLPLSPERDETGGDDLPTYDDLATQHGPNSRFGRWRQWIEKRAAERYADVTPDELERRRARGWGIQAGDAEPDSKYSSEASSQTRTFQPEQLHVQTHLSASQIPASPALPSEPSPPAALIPEVISPSRLQLCQFGSRFLPHTTSPIRCLLPILNDQFLLIGHDNGLSVLDMFPREWTDQGIMEKGPADAEIRHIWEGEAVYQMSILENESTGQGTPQGVVLALVGPDFDPTKEQEGIRTLRMYNLASLVSLAKWAVTRKIQQPLNLRRLHGSNRLGHTKRQNRQQPSLTRGLRNLVIDSPIVQPQSSSDASTEPQASYSDVADSPMYSKRLPPRPSERSDSIDSQRSWEFVDDMPLLWAAHYTPLASAGSRLLNTSVLFYDLWRNENQRSRGGALLAVATKSNIFLYEAPKGERAFRLIKEFYTPLTARSITFVQQSVMDTISRSSSDSLPRAGGHSQRHSRVVSLGITGTRYPNQLSLFVIFEKKAGIIRIADSAVGEVDLYEESGGLQQFLSAANTNPSTSRKSRASWDGGRAFTKEHRGSWVPPAKFTIPDTANDSLSKSMYVLTRGKQSHIVPHPLPPCISVLPPYRILVWSSPPTRVNCRVCMPSRGPPPFLQIVAFGEEGLEVIEIPLQSLSEPERKGKRREDDPVWRAISVIGGDTGFLCAGGHWSRPFHQLLARSSSATSTDSVDSSTSWSSHALAEKMRVHEGIYGWVWKGLEDWRVFWVGGTGAEPKDEDNESNV